MSVSLTAYQIETEFWSRQSKMLTLLQLKSSLRHAVLFPKEFILGVTIRTGVVGVDGEFDCLFLQLC
jgi:hypothetical protein